MKRLGTIALLLFLVSGVASAQNVQVLGSKRIATDNLARLHQMPLLPPPVTYHYDTESVAYFDPDAFPGIAWDMPFNVNFSDGTHIVVLQNNEHFTSSFAIPYLDTVIVVIHTRDLITQGTPFMVVGFYSSDSSFAPQGTPIPYPGITRNDSVWVRAQADYQGDSSYTLSIPFHHSSTKNNRGSDFWVTFSPIDTANNHVGPISDAHSDARDVDFTVDRNVFIYSTAHEDPNIQDSFFQNYSANFQFTDQNTGNQLFPNLAMNVVVHQKVVASVDQMSVAGGVSLSPNYPNPANDRTFLDFDLSAPCLVTLKVYNVVGQEVATVVSGYRDAGSYSIPFATSALASGTYSYVLDANGHSLTKTMVVSH